MAPESFDNWRKLLSRDRETSPKARQANHPWTEPQLSALVIPVPVCLAEARGALRMSANLREFSASSNGDRWYLGRDEETMNAYVVHKANQSSGGTTSHIEL